MKLVTDPPGLAKLEDHLEERQSLPLEHADDMTFDAADQPEIVEDVFGARRMSVVYGPSNSGKTTLMLDLALRMPTGRPWLGKRVMPSAVIYLAAESPNSVRLRKHAFVAHHGGPIGALSMVPCSLNLLDGSADVDALIDLIVQERDRLELPLSLLIVDTLARVMPGANENAGEDMSRLVAAGDRIRTMAGPHVCWIHHSGKDEARGARGHSSLRAAVDTEIEVSADPALRIHTLEVTKQRDLNSNGTKLSARFVPVELGVNQWGRPITACAVETDEPASPHLQAISRHVEQRHVEDLVVAGFRRLHDLGMNSTHTASSPDYLPRQMFKQQLGGGFDVKALDEAVQRLIGKGTLTISTIGFYGNRTPRKGLVLSEV